MEQIVPNTPQVSENTPNAAKLIGSLRHLDYDDVSAICDIVDNSVDAGATAIWIDIKGTKEGIEEVRITDNGKGMSAATLNEALKLGSETEKNPAFDLGRFGMGLITASISLGRRLEVTTQSVQEPALVGIHDIDEIVSANRFLKTLRICEKGEALVFRSKLVDRVKIANEKIKEKKDQLTADSGTTVVISKLDQVEFVYPGPLAKALAHKIGQSFRKFIQAGSCRFYIDGEILEAIDPINDFEPTLLFEDVIKKDAGTVEIQIFELKNYGPTLNKEYELNIPGQGFYVLRNNREILAGDTLNIFTKHNDYNMLRIELRYPATLDDIFRTNFSKRKTTLVQSIRDRISAICTPYIKQVRERAKRAQNTRNATDTSFTDVEKAITQKSHLLRTPAAEVEKREPKSERSEGKVKEDIEKHGPRLNISKRQTFNVDASKVQFRTKQLGAKGPIFDPDIEKGVIIVYWNADHPFYTNLVLPNNQRPEVFAPLAFFVWSLASAELRAKQDSDSLEILENIRYEVGANMGVLLQ